MRLFKNISYFQVAKLIASGHIVSIFQGRSEAGPRALGNRSILFSPSLVKGSYYINEIKGREWYRPVAGTILEEYFEDYFHTNGLKSSPFMSFALDLKVEKLLQIPAIAHIDRTCRIQTVNKKQNYHYYNLISAYNKLTEIPIIGNTSLNLGGEPMVETKEDAIGIIQRSEIEFLYMPESNSLVFSENN
jgi:carbamoyltransferase